MKTRPASRNMLRYCVHMHKSPSLYTCTPLLPVLKVGDYVSSFFKVKQGIMSGYVEDCVLDKARPRCFLPKHKNKGNIFSNSFWSEQNLVSYCVFFNTCSAHNVLRTIMLLYTHSVLTLYVHMWYDLLPKDLSVAKAISKTNWCKSKSH